MSEGGLWFEGLLVAINGSKEYTVDVDGEMMNVDADNIMRVTPWHCISVGDIVECLPEGSFNWFTGTVMAVDIPSKTYTVHLQGDDPDDVEAGVPESRIRKLSSHSTKAEVRWKAAFTAVRVTNSMGGPVGERDWSDGPHEFEDTDGGKEDC
ncbi:unnamed protein product [Chrysoparadoxa australica]